MSISTHLRAAVPWCSSAVVLAAVTYGIQETFHKSGYNKTGDVALAAIMFLVFLPFIYYQIEHHFHPVDRSASVLGRLKTTPLAYSPPAA